MKKEDGVKLSKRTADDDEQAYLKVICDEVFGRHWRR